MRRRGRPPTPDILTPREWEVLDLIRAGLTNQAIAGRLGISLSGAKHHVSEIISKLGVESREEAAAFDAQPARRWAFVPMLGLRVPIVVGWKALALTGVTVVVAAAIGVGALAGILSGAGARTTSLAATPIDPCAGRPGCSVIQQEQYTTLEEATRFASFEPMMPDYLPAGFEQKVVAGTKRDLTPNEHVSNPVDVHNDWITVVYRNERGEHLVISQGFPAQLAVGVYNAVLGQTPQHLGEFGTVSLDDRTAFWVSEGPLLGESSRILGTGFHLSFQVGGFGRGWGHPGSYFSGSPMSYAIASDSLSLDELVLIARSVELPAILPPLGGTTPPPGW